MKRLLFRNLHPLYGWMFSVSWAAIAISFAIVFYLKGSVASDPLGALIAVVFFLISPWVVFRFFQVPMISIWEGEGDDWVIVRRWLWKHVLEQVRRESLPMPTVEEESDGDGGKHYLCLLRLPTGAVQFGKYHRRHQAERTCDQMRAAIAAVDKD
jgi:hypothetical protein